VCVCVMAVVDVYTKIWGPCLMLDTYFYNSYFGPRARHPSGSASRACAEPILPHGRHERRGDGREVRAGVLR